MIPKNAEYKRITEILGIPEIIRIYKLVYGFPQYGIEPTTETLDELLTDEGKKIPKLSEFFKELHRRAEEFISDSEAGVKHEEILQEVSDSVIINGCA